MKEVKPCFRVEVTLNVYQIQKATALFQRKLRCSQPLQALTSIPVKPRIAMMDEITLRGRVLPIGGLREKLLTAVCTGIKTVIQPEQNKKDMEDIPANILDRLDTVFVSQSDEVLRCALMHLPDGGGLFIPADNIRIGVSDKGQGNRTPTVCHSLFWCFLAF